MSARPPDGANSGDRTKGSGFGGVETVLSVDEVSRQAEEIAVDRPDRDRLLELAGGRPLLAIEGLTAG
ncbi:MAG: hypothetical protein R3285_01940, partial [Kiloniellales bacterium]|nr:hypothetical protein [Kiloniellales bacterium]